MAAAGDRVVRQTGRGVRLVGAGDAGIAVVGVDGMVGKCWLKGWQGRGVPGARRHHGRGAAW